jgi:hypothetical protein
MQLMQRDVDEGDCSPTSGYFARYNLPAGSFEACLIFEVVLEDGENPSLEEIEAFCNLPENRRQGDSLFKEVARFTQGEDLGWRSDD